MNPERSETRSPIDYFTLALLLAEGQTRNVEERWSDFIDNLARITDAFAQARVRFSVREALKEEERVSV